MAIRVDSAAQPVKLPWKREQSLHLEAALTQIPHCKVTLVVTLTSGAQKDHAHVTAMTTAHCFWDA